MTTNVATNVKIGRVKVYTAPTSTADPVMATIAAPWTYLGWMSAATALMQQVGVLEINVDDLITPVDTVLNSRALGIDGSLAEWPGLANLNIVVGGTLSSVAPATGVAGYDLNEVKGSDDISRKAVLVEQFDVREIAGGSSLPEGRIRVWFPNCTIQPNGNIELSRKKESALPFSVRAHPALDGSEVLSRQYLVTGLGI